MSDNNKMIITGPNGVKTEVEVLITFYNKNETKQYIMYTRNEKQNENTIVYTSIVRKENNELFLDEILDDNEWAEVKNKIKELLS